MRPFQSTTAAQLHAFLQQVSRWSLALRDLHQRIAACFARPEPRHHALLYLQAILSDIPRKNGWHIAEHARQAHPYGMQRLLSRAGWDQEGVRDALRTALVQILLPPAPLSAEPDPLFPLLVLDESGFPKRGKHSAGVQPQYCGVSGRVENCQVGVFLSYVTELGHGLIDRALYLPEEWCRDPARRLAAHIPETVSFRTKPELAQLMVQRAHQAGLPIRWVVADTVYGHSPDLRLFLEEQGYAYALAIPSIEVVCVQTKDGCRLSDVASIQHGLGPQDWQPLSQSLGTKGERLFDWAIVPVLHQGLLDDRHFLVFRRCLDDPTQVTSYLVFALPATPLPIIVQAIGGRWHIEEDIQACKDLGLDQYEVRSYLGWYRHITLVLLAYAFLVGLCVQNHLACSAQAEPPPAVPLIPLTTSEARHLLARLIWPAPTSAPLICHWSWWRRTHQYWAGYSHRRRRETSGLSPACRLAWSPQDFSRHHSWEKSWESFRALSRASSWESSHPAPCWAGSRPGEKPPTRKEVLHVLLVFGRLLSAPRHRCQDLAPLACAGSAPSATPSLRWPQTRTEPGAAAAAGHPASSQPGSLPPGASGFTPRT